MAELSKLILHRHHVVPHHLGGGDGITVLITISEHAEEHRKLWEVHHRWQDYVAWKALSGQISYQEATRIAISEGGKYASSLHIGMKRSAKTCERISKAKRGKSFNRGTKRTMETRARMSASRRKSGHATHSGPLSQTWREHISNGHKKYHEEHKTERSCVECSHSFLTANTWAKFCSGKCKMRQWRNRCRNKKNYA
jgi:hypothetical protein